MNNKGLENDSSRWSLQIKRAVVLIAVEIAECVGKALKRCLRDKLLVEKLS